jgi:hypothetical protein
VPVFAKPDISSVFEALLIGVFKSFHLSVPD